MQKGYKRTGKGIAVLHFFIGLIILAIVVFAIYFFIGMMDYSDRLSPETSMRPYVEVTAAPESTKTPEPTVFAAETQDADVVDISGVTAVEATPEPTRRATVAPTAVATPEPTVIATASPEPTSIPASALSQAATSGFQMPAASDSATLDLTNIYASVADNNQIVQLQGYAYINNESFDGASVQSFLIVTQKASGKQIAYKANMVPGVSGNDHAGALCANAANSDFEAFISVKPYPDGEYTLGIVLSYTLSGKQVYSYHTFDDGFTVQSGAMLTGSTTGEQSFG